MQENGSDFTLSKPTEGVKLSGAAAGGATVNGSTLWRHPLGGGRRCNVRIGSSRSAVTMNISWHRLLLVRISQATGRRRYWTDILKIIFLIPCIRLYMQRIWDFFISIHVSTAKPAIFNCFRMKLFISIVFAQNTKTLCLDKKERQEYFNVEHNQHFS